jgi:hypothetical protein
MTDRGYPADEEDEQRIADLSVEHSHTLNRYRSAHDVSVRAGREGASTEELRNAMVDYRALFNELLEVDQSPETRDGAYSDVGSRPELSEAPERADSDLSAREDDGGQVEPRASEQSVDETADRSAEERRRAMTDEARESIAETGPGGDYETTTYDETRRV